MNKSLLVQEPQLFIYIHLAQKGIELLTDLRK